MTGNPEDAVLMQMDALTSELAIRDVLTCYCMTMDRGDIEGLGTCLAEGFTRTFGDQVMAGRDTFLEYTRRYLFVSGGHDDGPEAAEGRVTHFLGPVSVHVTGDLATADSYVMTFRAKPAGTDDRVRVRAVQWHDTFQREDDVWLLHERWMSESWIGEMSLITSAPVEVSNSDVRSHP